MNEEKKEKTIYDLKLHEVLILDEEIEGKNKSGFCCMKVHKGWIYTTVVEPNVFFQVFIPYKNLGNQRIELENG